MPEKKRGRYKIREIRSSEVTQHLSLVDAAGYTNLDKQLGYRVDAHVAKARSGAHAIALNTAVQDFGAGLQTQSIHSNPSSIQFIYEMYLLFALMQVIYVRY